MAKGVVTSTGRIIDLDSDNEIQNLPPESLQMEKRSYGFDSSPFSVSIKRNCYTIRTNFNQWYCSPNGRAKLIGEINEMEKFPFDVFLQQNTTNGDISYLTVIRMNGVEHDVLLTYDCDHPDFEMRAKVLRPMLDMTRMRGHYYGPNEICYLHDWSRKYRAIHVAMQVTFFLNDYYRGSGNTPYITFPLHFGSALDQLQRQYGIFVRH